MVNMIMMHTLHGRLLLIKNLHAMNFLRIKGVRAATSEFTDFASVWWVEHGQKNPYNIPQTWEALKRIMRAIFVPSYYARDLLNRLQKLRQGTKV
jgi:hypothetical protein